MEHKCDICDFKEEWGLIFITGKSRTLTFCPNHLHQYGEDLCRIEPKPGKCQCCGSDSIVTVRQREHSYDLCPDHALAYISYNLKPKDFLKLYQEDSFDFFLHDDFYAEDGMAYQPDRDLVERGMKILRNK